MKKHIILSLIFILLPICLSFTQKVDKAIEKSEENNFSINTLGTRGKKFNSEPIETCGLGSVKSYMDYRAITNTASKQYKYIREYMTVDDETGFLYDEDGFIGAALGSYYGVIGDRFYFTFENGAVIPIVKIESKADIHTDENNCYNPNDNSVIEFVIDKDIANEYFGYYGNGLVLSGNFGNYPLFRGNIINVEKVTDDVIEKEEEKKEIDYNASEDNTDNELNIFYYASGY